MNFELAHLLAGDWLIAQSDFRRLILPMIERASAASATDIKAAQDAYAGRETGPVMLGDVAVISLSGPITYKSSWFSYFFGACAIEDLQMQFRAAMAEPAVKTIVFRVNSPGGTIDMVSEFADEIFAARGQGKAIIAVADTAICSAAYWLASQAETIYATRSSQLGAIGVFCERDDISGMLAKAGIVVNIIAHGKNKAQGIETQPMSEDEQANLQAKVDEIGDWFDSAVARGRNVAKSVVLETFGQGDVFRGEQAIKLGLADKKQTFGQVLSRLTKRRVTTVAARAAAVAGALTVRAAAPKADDETPVGCPECSPSCPCDEQICPDDCPTCDDDCACRMAAAAKAKAIADAAAAIDEAAILTALAEEG